jgi:hypothetical protein
MEIDAYTIAAKRMAVGDAVSEHYLYGREACELIKRRLVTEETMKAYRSAAFFARRQRYGEQAALAWEAEQKDIHEKSKAMLRDGASETRAIRIPSMKPVRAYSEAAE